MLLIMKNEIFKLKFFHCIYILPSFQESHYQFIPLLIQIMMKYSKNASIISEVFKYHHDGDAGIDLNISYDVIGNSSEVSTIDFKIQCEIIK